jgi:hypothetical protein
LARTSRCRCGLRIESVAQGGEKGQQVADVIVRQRRPCSHTPAEWNLEADIASKRAWQVVEFLDNSLSIPPVVARRIGVTPGVEFDGLPQFVENPVVKELVA